MNSSLCVVETPKKKFISVKSGVSPSLVLQPQRFSPPKSILTLLSNAARIHAFQFHTEVSFSDLREMNSMNQKLVNYLCSFFTSESPDIPDVIVKLETIALEESYFGQFLKEYIAEEFCIQSDYSFCVLAILNYMNLYKLSVDEAICDIFRVSSSELLCLLCIDCPEDSKEELVKRNNCNILKSRIVVELDILDDSFDDPDYLETKKHESSDEDIDVYKFQDETDFVNPFETIKMPDPVHDSSEFVNPFVDNKKEDFVNPFEREDSVKIQSVSSSPNFNPYASSSPKISAKLKSEKACPHCDKTFPSNYNMKQHLVSIHKIFPDGLTIFKCDYKDCNFVTGSKAMFSRHSHAKCVQIDCVVHACTRVDCAGEDFWRGSFSGGCAGDFYVSFTFYINK